MNFTIYFGNLKQLKLNILQKKLSQLFIRDRTVELLDSL